MQYAIVTENDESQWLNETSVLSFPGKEFEFVITWDNLFCQSIREK